MVREPTRMLTGVLKSKGLDYFLEAEDADIFLIDVSYRYRRLIGCDVVVEGIPTGLYTLRVEHMALAP